MPPPFINFTDMSVKYIKLPDNSVIPVEDNRIASSSPSNGHLLEYDSSAGEYKNKAQRTVNGEVLTGNGGDINLHDGFYFPNAVQDYDGNWYGAVVIGNQVWLGEDLKTKHMPDGTAIENGGSVTSSETPYYYEASSPYSGIMYNLPAILSGDTQSSMYTNGTYNGTFIRGISPYGFHLPTNNELYNLVNYLKANKRYIFGENPNKIAKSLASTTQWVSSDNEYAIGNDQTKNNASGFNAKPKQNVGSSNHVMYGSVWHQSSIYALYFYGSSSECEFTTTPAYSKVSLRCISDLTPVQFKDWYINQYGSLQHILPKEQVQSDWNQTDNTAVDFIKNKPTITSDILICNYSNNAVDKTPQEIYEAYQAGMLAVCYYNNLTLYLVECDYTNSTYFIRFDSIANANNQFPDLYYLTYDGTSWALSGKKLQQKLIGSGTSQNIKTINGENILGSGNIDVDEVFWCTYNDTNNTMNGLTVQQIIDAKTNNKIVCCKHGNLIHICTGASNSYIIFSCLTSGTTAGETVSASGNIVSYIVYSASSQAWGKSTIYLQESLTSGTNIKTINGESILGSGNITTPSGVVSCTYNGNMTTASSITGLTLQEMYDAKTAGKEVLCMRGDEVYRLQTINSAFTYVIFQGVYSGHAAQIIYNPSDSLWYLAYASDMNVQSDWNQTNTSADDYIKNKPTLGTAAAKDSTNAVTANSTDLVESGAVKSAIDAAISASYHHAGTKTVAELLPALLVAANEGNVYNITDSGETTSDFIEGAGKPINIGDNVGIAQVSTGVYKFDLLSGFIDTSNFATKDEVPQKIDDLSNVSVNTPSDKDILQYNADDSKWESKASPKMHIYPHNNVLCFDGYPFLFNESGLSDEDVALIYKDKKTGLKKYLISDTASQYMSLLDSNRFELLPYVRFHRGKNGRSVAMHKTGISGMLWAADNKYILECDLTADGGFTWAITVNDKVSGGTVEWTAGVTTLSDIVSQLVSGRHSDTSSTYLDFTLDDNENPTKIRIRQRTYTNSTFTLSNNTGATLTDLSTFCKIGETEQGRDHRTWQAQSVTTLFPSSGIIAPNTVQYSVSGLNLSYRCGGNETRYKTYYTANGSTSYLAESSVSSRMTPTAFANLNGSGVAEQQALYDKYDGSWDAYMEASMIALDDTHTNGIEYQSYDNGDTQTAFLASVMTMDFDGTYVPAYPAAYAAHSITSKEFGAGNMPTNHEIGVFMRDEKLAKINAAFSLIGSATNLVNTSYYWSVAQYGSNGSWLYYGGTGTVDYTGKYNYSGGRSLVYLNS